MKTSVDCVENQAESLLVVRAIDTADATTVRYISEFTYWMKLFMLGNNDVGGIYSLIPRFSSRLV